MNKSKKHFQVRTKLQVGRCGQRCKDKGCSGGGKDALGTCWCYGCGQTV